MALNRMMKTAPKAAPNRKLDTIRCQCAEVTGGDACTWSGPPSETVIVEFIPREHRASHEAAGNTGVYPHNGARRVRCEISCADRLAHVWVDEEQTDALDPWVSIVEVSP